MNDREVTIMEKIESDNLAYAAYHEAGHAVARCLLGLPILSTTIIPSSSDNYMGVTTVPIKKNPSRQEILDEMVVRAAGTVATEAVRSGNLNLVGVEDDFERIRNYAKYLAAGDHSEYLRLCDEAHIRARTLLRTPIHRLAVKRVAEALLEKQILDHAEVQQIIDQTLLESNP